MAVPFTRLLVRLVRRARQRLLNPTRDWPTRSVSRLEFDVRSHRLSGVPIEAPIAAARPFGPADWVSGGGWSPDLDYRSLGLRIHCFEETITSFRVILRPGSRSSARDRAFRAAELALIGPGGATSHLSVRTNEGDLVRLLGPPVETGPIAGNRVHSFVVQGNLIETYHDPVTRELLELELTLFGGDESTAEAEPGEDAQYRRSA